LISILDKRLVAKPYGRQMLEALPPAPVVHEWEEVTRFWSRVSG